MNEDDDPVQDSVDSLTEMQNNLEKRFESIETNVKDLKDCFATFMFI